MTEEKPGGHQLGRGLSALFGEENDDYAELDSLRQSKTVPVEFIRPNRNQPRRDFDGAQIDSLVASIRERGILQPILVRKDPQNPDGFEIVAGERRWRAAQLARLHEIPVIIKDLTDAGALEIALVENIQRQDLNVLEEADGYRRLIDEYRHTQEVIAKAVGKSRSHVANTLRLLNLPEPVRRILATGDISAGHARALLNADDPEDLARKIVKQGLNVRQTERLVQRQKEARGEPGRKSSPAKDPDTIALETDLSGLLGLKVSINFRGAGGELVIHYNTLDQLDEVLRRIKFDQMDSGRRGTA